LLPIAIKNKNINNHPDIGHAQPITTMNIHANNVKAESIEEKMLV
jgi:hypothetical protein